MVCMSERVVQPRMHACEQSVNPGVTYTHWSCYLLIQQMHTQWCCVKELTVLWSSVPLLRMP